MKLIPIDSHHVEHPFQKKMLEKVRQRAQQADLLTRIRLHQNTPASIGLEEPVDFALAFWMVHEVANKEAFFREVRDLLKPTARFLVVEPKIHVKASAFDRIVGMARAAGLQLCSEVQVAISRAALLAP